MRKSSTHLSAQLSVQAHFYPFFRPSKQSEKGTFGHPFLSLQQLPFNGSFNTPFNARLPCHHVAHERPPYTPSHTLEPPKYAYFPAHTHMATARPTPAPRRKPHKASCRLASHPFPAVLPPTKEKPPGVPFLAVMPSGSMPSAAPASGASSSKLKPHHFQLSIKPN